MDTSNIVLKIAKDLIKHELSSAQLSSIHRYQHEFAKQLENRQYEFFRYVNKQDQLLVVVRYTIPTGQRIFDWIFPDGKTHHGGLWPFNLKTKFKNGIPEPFEP